MFGDHQPNIETAYLQELLGVDSLYSMSTRQDQQRYVTPFYIWANYDIGERTVERPTLTGAPFSRVKISNR